MNEQERSLLTLLDFCHDGNPDGQHVVDRFRGIDKDVDEDGEPVIVLCTRTGGGNRESYREEWDAIRKHPNYIWDRDDDDDATFAYTYFSVPSPA